MLILGVQGGSKLLEDDDQAGFNRHDSAAVLLRDGAVIAAIEEERLSRIKHTNCFPLNAIRYCLHIGKCSLQDIDIVATNNDELYTDVAAKTAVLDDPSYCIKPDGRSHFAAPFVRMFNYDIRDKIYFCNHHFAHAWSAYAMSGFNRSLIASLDGDGDNTSGMVLTGDGMRLRKLQEYRVSQSLGALYQSLIKFIGYDRFDEYKVMGLAPYGNPSTFRRAFQECYSLLPKGNYSIEPPVFWLTSFERAGLVAQARRKSDAFLQIHMDFAASLQEVTEEIALHVIKHFQQETQERTLCLAGGVAHNCTMNGAILYSKLFNEVFVQPAAHDAGGALGAALGAWHTRNPCSATTKKLSHVYWGTDIGTDDDIASVMERWTGFISYKRVDSIAVVAANLLANGAVLGWVQGRSEFGPRALGNRSILADPRPGENKVRINQMVKKREQYRPFAPSILEEDFARFFKSVPGQVEFPFMVFVLDVQEEMRGLLGAITHVDGTARVQSVSKRDNWRYWELIKEFEKLTGVPILLNTSFNNNAEPIVDSVDDAVNCFLTTGIDYLVVGNYLVTKESPTEIEECVWNLVPRIPISRKLTKRWYRNPISGGSDFSFVLESTKSKHFGPQCCPVTDPMYKILQFADGQTNFRTAVEQSGVQSDLCDLIVRELIDLWTQRVIILSPR